MQVGAWDSPAAQKKKARSQTGASNASAGQARRRMSLMESLIHLHQRSFSGERPYPLTHSLRLLSLPQLPTGRVGEISFYLRAPRYSELKVKTKLPEVADSCPEKSDQVPNWVQPWSRTLSPHHGLKFS